MASTRRSVFFSVSGKLSNVSNAMASLTMADGSSEAPSVAALNQRTAVSIRSDIAVAGAVNSLGKRS
jgi:hypothetical protein